VEGAAGRPASDSRSFDKLDIADEMAKSGTACDWQKFPGGHYKASKPTCSRNNLRCGCREVTGTRMCNLYSMTTNVEAIRRLFEVDVSSDKSGNLPAMPGIYPDYPAPIVRNGTAGRELAMARWGMPSSQKALMDAAKKRAEKLQAKGKTVDFKELLRLEPDSGTTNIRNVSSAHWKRWLGPETVALYRSRRFPNTTRSTARRRRSGLPRKKAGRCCVSPGCGPIGPVCARPRKARSPPTSSLS
jgi:hypothetical protein